MGNYTYHFKHVGTNEIIIPSEGPVSNFEWPTNSITNGPNDAIYPANSVFDWVFATWRGSFDTSSPLGFMSDPGAIDVTYWFHRTGGNGGDTFAYAYALFLGGANSNASFSVAANPIESVNPPGAWDNVSHSVATGDDAVTVRVKDILNGDRFDTWLPVWGTASFSNRDATTPAQRSSWSAVVYKPPSFDLPRFDIPEPDRLRDVLERWRWVFDPAPSEPWTRQRMAARAQVASRGAEPPAEDELSIMLSTLESMSLDEVKIAMSTLRTRGSRIDAAAKMMETMLKMRGKDGK